MAQVLTYPLIQPLTIWAGADFRAAWVYREPPLEGEDPVTGAFINLSGTTVTVVITNKDVAVLTLTDNSQEMTVTPQVGLIELNLTGAQTKTLPFKTYVSGLPGLPTCHFTLQLETLDGTIEYLASGPVTVNGQ